ncbi:MAG TPA: ABC-type transport auxiliary lipoprotein family protein [Kofleriaceae bacterium]|nr:ABC-type transport auxiliary lipoprotein family protein [Kofleriaceae bacterium]
MSRPIRGETVAVAGLVAALTAACFGGGSTPQINYYALSPPDTVAKSGVAPAIAVEELRAQAPYDERRIVYRTSPYQLSYYEYDQWAAAPGVLVADYLRRAYQASGRFGLVLPRPGTDTAAILGGQVLAFEETGRSKPTEKGASKTDTDAATTWKARIVLDLELRDAESGRILWTRRTEQEIALASRKPEALAAALSKALTEIAATTASEVATAATTATAARQ